MLSPLLITLREGMEAALIIGILLAFLAKSGYRREFKFVWAGTGLAVIVSVLAGAALYLIAGEFEGRGEQIFEGLAMLLATGILTWMVFWMRRQAADIKGHLQARLSSALTRDSVLGLVMLAFVVVVREGIETALLLFSASQLSDSPMLFVIGGGLGLIAAVAIGWGLYRGSTRLNLRLFFNITSAVLIVFAAGLLAHAVHELQEANIFPIFVAHVWDMNHVLNESSGVGAFLAALIGYNGNPSLLEVIGGGAFLFGGLGLYFRSGTKPRNKVAHESTA